MNFDVLGGGSDQGPAERDNDRMKWPECCFKDT